MRVSSHRQIVEAREPEELRSFCVLLEEYAAERGLLPAASGSPSGEGS